MKNKILCIFVVILFLAIIPSTSIATEKQSDAIWTLLRGTIKIHKIENK